MPIVLLQAAASHPIRQLTSNTVDLHDIRGSFTFNNVLIAWLCFGDLDVMANTHIKILFWILMSLKYCRLDVQSSCSYFY